MKNFIKYTAVAVAGYLVGFYELKYRLMKSMLTDLTKKNKEAEEEEES